jgi:hypothetical protein
VDGYNGPKTKTALIKALQTELNKQFNKRLVVDGKWGAKTKAAIVTVQKGILHGFYRLHFIWRGLTLDHLILSLEKVQSRLYINFRRHGGFLQIGKLVKVPLLNCLLHNQKPLLILSRGYFFVKALLKVLLNFLMN